ncbi:MAG: excinuclease ABC subunit UvrB [Dehalococcoidia bacterium]|nr:excinuclease ABC subunit UvrB [Dehalococcoidia bacterium]
MPDFQLVADYQPTGDQPDAIAQLTEGVLAGARQQTLLGVTGSGKTFTMANIIQQTQRTALVLCHNKTLAAQLYQEFKDFFPHNSVEYFVSYYDYYQPEAYIPQSDTYIEKDSDVNEEIDKLRHAATRALLEHRDTIIVASVSCIYGLGAPEEYQGFVTSVVKGSKVRRDTLIRRLVDMQYERNDLDFTRGRFRIRGDTLEIQPSYETIAIRIEFWGDDVERIVEIDPLTGELLADRDQVDIYPAKHFVTSAEKLEAAIEDIKVELAERIDILKAEGKILEAARLEARTNYDIEILRETGFCHGVENYSCHLARRHRPSHRMAEDCGSMPWTLLDYFPPDWLLFVDESHITLPQVRGMYNGDRARKETLVDFGFRLPSAMDNRPLTWDEFEAHINQVVYVSATPGPYEHAHSSQVVEQIIRPTGLLDPPIDIRPTRGQIDDLLAEIKDRVMKSQRVLVTTLTKRMAEELADYLKEMGVKTQYLHSEIETFERVEILRDLRLGIYDVVVGINLLREGLDLPEVSLVAILDADKEGFLRSQGSLIQTIGRAARHVEGRVIMYADHMTDSMKTAISETDRRRAVQEAHNAERGITPAGIHKAIRDITDRVKMVAEESPGYNSSTGNLATIPKDELFRLIKDLEVQMKQASKDLEYERAALIRDQIALLRGQQSLLRDDEVVKMGERIAGGVPKPPKSKTPTKSRYSNSRTRGK